MHSRGLVPFTSTCCLRLKSHLGERYLSRGVFSFVGLVFVQVEHKTSLHTWVQGFISEAGNLQHGKTQSHNN